MNRLFVASLVLLVGAQSALAQDWEPLFNGTDLSGWKANNSPGSFRVEDGLLRVQASEDKAAHLFYVGDLDEGTVAFENFEFEATVRSEPNSNSGVFFHTDMSVRNRFMHLANGYEVQLNSTAKERRKTGSLYGIVDLDESPVDETEWFTIRIVVEDKDIAAFINGDKVMEYHEPRNPQRSADRVGRVLRDGGGAIALQAHDKNSVWYFKDIRVRRLR